MSIYTGVNGTAKKATAIYAGVNGTARKVISAYAGDENGVAKLVYTTYNVPVSFPTYTSANSKITYSDQYNATTRAAWRAFDKNTSNSWWSSANSALPHWIQYDFGFLVLAKYLDFWNTGTSYTPAKSCTLLGSTDGSSFDEILTHTFENQTGQQQTVEISGKAIYRYYRFRVNSVWNSNRYGQVMEWDIRGFKQP